MLNYNVESPEISKRLSNNERFAVLKQIDYIWTTVRHRNTKTINVCGQRIGKLPNGNSV